MELRIDPNVTSAHSLATVEDVYGLHNADPDPDATGDGVTVAVVDTGVDTSHDVFEEVDVRQVDFTGYGEGDVVGHGTGVAGILAQLAPDVEIVSLRVFGDSGRTGMQPIGEAYDWLVEHAGDVDLCNVSWGADRDVDNLNEEHQRILDEGVQDVVAAGNTGGRGGSPATAQGAFSVGALTVDGRVTRFSSYDPNRDNPDVAALGKDVRLARADGTSFGRVVDDDWVKGSGTSFAAPVTAGLVARYLSKHDGGVVENFEASARNIPGTPEEGEGVVDHGRAMKRAGGKSTTSASVYGVAGFDFLVLEKDLFDSGSYEAIKLDERTLQLENPPEE